MPIFVARDKKRTYPDALQFGALQFISNKDVSGPGDFQNDTAIKNAVSDFFANYIQGVDLILISDKSLMTAEILMYLPPGEHDFVKWDRTTETAKKHRLKKKVKVNKPGQVGEKPSSKKPKKAKKRRKNRNAL